MSLLLVDLISYKKHHILTLDTLGRSTMFTIKESFGIQLTYIAFMTYQTAHEYSGIRYQETMINYTSLHGYSYVTQDQCVVHNEVLFSRLNWTKVH